MYYLRKISRGKWPREQDIAQATLKDIPMDTVIAEFKTENNKLSLWEADTQDDLNDAFVALASNMQAIETIFAVKLDSKKLPEFTFDDELGSTPAVGINRKHHNIVDLNYVNLGDVIQVIIDGLSGDCLVKRTRGQMKKLLVDAYKKGRLDEKLLHPNMQKEIVRACSAAKLEETGI